ncbi:MAG: GtrA family protein [Proteobacteria bacterium]|nr:GtrA family protein [Pseudomonadota bacterium]
MKSLGASAIWFIVVGCLAAAVHFGVVVALVHGLDLAPLVANVAGWLVAFVVSFSGHFHLTFRALRAPLLRSAWRFFMVSALGFLANEAAYAVLLRWTGLNYALTLAIVLIAVAVSTWLLSRHWAFLGSPARR